MKKDSYHSIINYITNFFMFSLILMLFFQVLNRFVFHIPLPWTEEAGRYLFVATCLFGTVVALRENKHIRIEVFTGMLSEKKLRIINLFADLMILIFSIFLTWTGIIYTRSALNRNWEFGPIPIAPVYAILPITGALMIYEIVSIITASKNKIKKQVE